MRFDIQEMAQACAGSIVVPAAPGACGGSPVWDSREVVPGSTFVSLVGEKVDGHKFIPQVVEAGAACVLISHEVPVEVLDAAAAAGCGVIRVPGTCEEALVDIAAAWRKHLAGSVIAVTGSSGKTTTKNLIASVLSAGMSCVATLANQNNELGVPRTVLRAETDTQAVVVEMGMRGAGQLEELCQFVRPDVAVITNVGQSHIELLGSQENIARAKGEVLGGLVPGGWAFMNVNNGYVASMLEWADASERGIKVALFGREDAKVADLPQADFLVLGKEVSLDAAGLPQFTICVGEEQKICHLKLAGLHNVDNALCAAALGIHLGMSLGEVVDALEQAVPAAGRQQVHKLASGVTVVDDAYNANPDSMTASLITFAAMKAQRHVAILGDMGELGNFAVDGHKRMGALVASLGIEKLICVGSLSELLAKSALEGGVPESDVTLVSDWKQALEVSRGIIMPGDCVLVKASHSMELDKVVEGLIS